MTDKVFIKIQNDIKKSNPIIINNDDNISNIKKNLSTKYTEEISDSDDELSSYKKRNNVIISNIPAKTKNNNKVKKPTNNNDNNNDAGIREMIIERIPAEFEETKFRRNSNNKVKNPTNNTDNNSNIDGESDIEYEFQEDFEDKVKNYVKSDNKIRELQTQIKELNVSKKNAEQEILKHLERLGDTKINITGGKLSINQYESKESFKETIVKNVMTEKIKDPKIIDIIIESINEKRIENAKVQISLKRTFGKNNDNKKKKD